MQVHFEAENPQRLAGTSCMGITQPDRCLRPGADAMGEVTCLSWDSFVKPWEINCSQEFLGPESYNNRWR